MAWPCRGWTGARRRSWLAAATSGGRADLDLQPHPLAASSPPEEHLRDRRPGAELDSALDHDVDGGDAAELIGAASGEGPGRVAGRVVAPGFATDPPRFSAEGLVYTPDGAPLTGLIPRNT